jgi:hypothetical protein
MVRRLPSLLFAVGCAALAACAVEAPSPAPSPQEGHLEVSAHSATRFEATYALGSDSARVEVEYTATSTRFELRTSLGSTLVHEGTAFTLRDDWRPDARTGADGRLVLTPSDAEYALVYGLHQELLALGAVAEPSPAQRGSTLYAAGYLTARLLGDIPVAPDALTSHEDPADAAPGAQRWPYPGYADASLMPEELRLVHAQNGNGMITCCGPFECGGCDWSDSIACDDWCAAGDHCNKYHPGSGCGTAMFWPSGGVNDCPHSDGSAFLAAGTDWPYYNYARNYCYQHGWP